MDPGHDVSLLRAARLRSQHLVPGAEPWRDPTDVVRGMVVMQAQDGAGVRWAIASRTSSPVDDRAVLAAHGPADIVRNRPSRGTLGVATAADMGWLTATMAPRSLAASRRRRSGIGVTEAMVDAAHSAAGDALGGGRTIDRDALIAATAARCGPLDSTQASHVLRCLTEEMAIVFAPPDGTGDRFVSPTDLAVGDVPTDRDEALGRLAAGFVAARAPVTPACLGWWANLTAGDVRRAVAAAGAAIETAALAGTEYLVAPGSLDLRAAEVAAATDSALLAAPFDEYLLGYRDRDPVLDPAHAPKVVPGRNGMFKPVVVLGGEVVGTWSRAVRGGVVRVAVEPFSAGAPARMVERLAPAAEAYGAFLGLDAELVAPGLSPG